MCVKMKKRISVLVLFALFLTASAMVSGSEDCELVDRVPLGSYCNIVTFSVNASNISQFYTDADCTIDYYNTSGGLEVDGGVMTNNSDGSYNYSVSSNFDGFAYYKVTCVKGDDYGSSTGSVNFGLDDLGYLAEINSSVSEINNTITDITNTLASVDTNVDEINSSIAELNESIALIDETLEGMDMSLASMNESLDSLESQATTRNSILGQFLQVLEDIYGVIWSADDVSDRYHVLVDDNSTFTTPEINRRTSDSNLTIDQSRYLQNGTVYYWKARVVEDGGYGGWSDVWQFTASFD